jgi:hypothetical protein
MSFPAVHLFEFSNQDLRDMVLLVTLIHRLFPDAAGIFRIPRCWRPDSPSIAVGGLFCRTALRCGPPDKSDRRVNLKFRECLINDLLLRASGLRIFEPVKQVLHRIVILLQKGEGRLSLQQLKYN